MTEVDSLLPEPADLHCIGGFVVSQLYGFSRETADVDILTTAPFPSRCAVPRGGGQKARRYVGVANYPDGYEARLIRAFPVWENIRLWALEPHDLALTKIERGIERDIRDVMYLAQAGLIQRDTLVARFRDEMESYLVGPRGIGLFLSACQDEEKARTFGEILESMGFSVWTDLDIVPGENLLRAIQPVIESASAEPLRNPPR